MGWTKFYLNETATAWEQQWEREQRPLSDTDVKLVVPRLSADKVRIKRVLANALTARAVPLSKQCAEHQYAEHLLCVTSLAHLNRTHKRTAARARDALPLPGDAS